MAPAQSGGQDHDPDVVSELRRHGIPALASTLPALRDELDQWARSAGLNGSTSESLALAGYEAMANAVEHAYTDSDGVLDIVATRYDNGTVQVTITDHGTWVTPHHSDERRGRGLPLIQRLSDETMITTSQNGTRVRMRWTAPLHDNGWQQAIKH